MIKIIQNGKQVIPILTFKCDRCECVVESDEYQTKPISKTFIKRFNLDCGTFHVLTCPNCKSNMYEYKHWSINEV